MGRTSSISSEWQGVGRAGAKTRLPRRAELRLVLSGQLLVAEAITFVGARTTVARYELC